MNKHFATVGDVWKHLPLAEILRLNPPRHYWETHAGSASYPLITDPPRQHGALRFLAHAPDEPGLGDCAYLQALRAIPGTYPGSPLLATKALGHTASYLFCDIDPESAASLRDTLTGLDAHVVEADGVTAIARQARLGSVDPASVLVLIDPFDPLERWTPDSMTPVELAGWLAGAGYRVLFWYFYHTLERRGWMRAVIASLAPGIELWCGDLLTPAAFTWPGRPGPFGCGIVLANTPADEMNACEQLGLAYERMSAGDLIEGNDPPRLIFQAIA